MFSGFKSMSLMQLSKVKIHPKNLKLLFSNTGRCYSSILPNFINGRRKPKVAVINLNGVIQAPRPSRLGATKTLNLEGLEKHIEKAFSLKRLQEVCLVINSPGGSPVQSELIADKILRCSAGKSIHVTSFVEDMAVSGGYWLACAGAEIFSAENSIIGSIGAVIGLFGFQDFIKQYGVQRRVYTAGKNKLKLDMFSEEKEEDVEWAQTMLQNIHTNFKGFVEQQRSKCLTSDKDLVFNGNIWIAKDAVNLGLIDGIKTFDGYVKQKYGNEVNVVRVNPSQKTGLSALFQSNFTPTLCDLEDMNSQRFTYY